MADRERERLHSLPTTSGITSSDPYAYSSMYTSSSGFVETRTSNSSKEQGPTAEKKGELPFNLGQIASLGITATSLASEILLSHPCIVLRRQTQLHAKSTNYHIAPFTLIPITYRLISYQGVQSLFKGLSSALIIRGLGVTLEGFLADPLGLPKDITRHSSLKKIGQHLGLKMLTGALIAPFYASALVESVQSQTASVAPTFLSMFSNAFERLVPRGFGSGGSASTFGRSNLYPLWRLVLPFALFYTTHYIVRSLIQNAVRARLLGENDDDDYDDGDKDQINEEFIADLESIEDESGGPRGKSSDYKPRNDLPGSANSMTRSLPPSQAQAQVQSQSQPMSLVGPGQGQASPPTRRPLLQRSRFFANIGLRSRFASVNGRKTNGNGHSRSKQKSKLSEREILIKGLLASCASALIADVFVYPAETILHRLLMQGTRVIIDNSDSGDAVIPIACHYSGIFDTVSSILVCEGPAGFYKGFGALIVQYTINLGIIKLVEYAFRKLSVLENAHSPTALAGRSTAESGTPLDVLDGGNDQAQGYWPMQSSGPGSVQGQGRQIGTEPVSFNSTSVSSNAFQPRAGYGLLNTSEYGPSSVGYSTTLGPSSLSPAPRREGLAQGQGPFGQASAGRSLFQSGSSSRTLTPSVSSNPSYNYATSSPMPYSQAQVLGTAMGAGPYLSTSLPVTRLSQGDSFAHLSPGNRTLNEPDIQARARERDQSEGNRSKDASTSH